MKNLLLFVVCCSLFKVSAQQEQGDTISPWTLGIAVGYYLPGDATAAFYNAKDNGRLTTLLYLYRQEIRDALNGYESELESYAEDIRYNNAASFELQVAYNFGQNWNIAVHFHNVKLTASGIFTLRVQRQNQNNNLEPYLEKADITGRERRSQIGLGVGKKFNLGSNFYCPVEIGLDLNFVEVEENKVNIAGKNFSLPMYNNPLNPQGGNLTTFGKGFYTSAGIGYQLPARYGLLLRLTYFRTTINVNDVVKESTSVLLPSLGFTKSF